MRVHVKDRLIGAVRLEHTRGLVAVRRRDDAIVLSGIWPGGIMSKQEALAVAVLLEMACLPFASKAPALAGSWIAPPVLDGAVT